jgi:hypothetical protein
VKSICIFGDSHVGSLRRAWRRHGAHLQELASIDFFSSHGAYWGRFEHSVSDDVIRIHSNSVKGRSPLELDIRRNYDLIVFSSPLHSSPTFRHRIWHKYCLPEQSEEHPKHHVMSYASGEAWITRRLQSRFSFMQDIKSSVPQFVVFEPPKPLFRVPTRYQLSRSLVVAADELHRGVVFKWLHQSGIDAITAPEFTHQDGLTLENYSTATEGDPHHGSFLYSIAMLEKLLGVQPKPAIAV